MSKAAEEDHRWGFPLLLDSQKKLTLTPNEKVDGQSSAFVPDQVKLNAICTPDMLVSLVSSAGDKIDGPDLYSGECQWTVIEVLDYPKDKEDRRSFHKDTSKAIVAALSDAESHHYTM